MHKFPQILALAPDVLNDDAPCLGIVSGGIAVYDLHLSECGRFEVDPEEEYGMTPADLKALADLQKVVEDAVEDAINAACLTIQDHLGVTDGGFAGVFFSGNERRKPLLEVFIDYAASEVNFNREPWED